MGGDDGWHDSQPELVGRIRAEIEEAPDRRITFARFMERALTEPGIGYYASRADRPTRAGDFLTAAELHPFFGRCIGRFIGGVSERIGEPSGMVVREYGAGRGTLERDALAGLAIDRPATVGRVSWEAIDVPERQAQGATQPSTGKVTGVVLANEFLDALPVHRLVGDGDDVREAWVTWQDDWFAESVGALSDERLTDPLTASGISLNDGQRAEVCPAATEWMTAAASQIHAGAILVIDYGHPAAELYGPRRMDGSLLTYRDHVAGDDPFDAVGEQDITAHVDTTALTHAADAAGLTLVGDTSQAEFLQRLGLGELLSDLGRRPGTDVTAYTEARAAVARLMDPRHLGGFRVLAWERSREGRSGDEATVPGFATA